VPTTTEALQKAVQFHQSGQLQQAEQIYRQILRFEPQHADALHLLGLIAHQVGQHDSALRHIGDAIALDKTNAVYHNNLGEVYRALGKREEAQACYQEAIRINLAGRTHPGSAIRRRGDGLGNAGAANRGALWLGMG
jgi:Flp pilus assembly protein TadD